MSFRVYGTHPLIDAFGSLFDPAETQSFGERCEGGPCGSQWGRGRGRFHHRGGPHGRQHHGDRGEQNNDSSYVPAADIYSTETDYKVYISLSSAEKETIELTYDPNTRELAVSGTLARPAEFASLDEEALQKVLLQSERKVGRFERKLKIPSDESERIQFEEAVAKFDNGVLELTLPKVEKEGAKRIVID